MSNRGSLSRRTVLKSAAAAAAAAPYVITSTALGAAGVPPASERLTVGMIGMGKQAQGHLSTMLGRKECQVLAVCDVQSERREPAKARTQRHYAARRAAGTYKGCDSTVDFRELTARGDLDAAVICTPDHWHAIVVIAAAKAGMDIYCEKPLSLTLREGRAMVDAVRRYGRVFQTGSWQRSRSNFRLACEMVRSGRIGKVHTVHVNVGGPSVDCYLPPQPVRKGVDWDMWLGPAPQRPFHETICPPTSFGGWPQWRRFRDYSGGSMTDMGAHHFDIAQWGLGMDHTGPVEIIPPSKDQKLLAYKYANGVTMFHGGGRSSIDFIGPGGRIMVGRGHLSTDPKSIMAAPIGADEVHLQASGGHHEDWLRCIKTRRRPICDVEIGVRSVSVCHLGNIGYWLKRPLKWDPGKEEFVNDAEANRWLDRAKRAPWRL